MSYEDVSLEVFPSHVFPSVAGAHEGEAVWTRNDIIPGDLYRLKPRAARRPMRVQVMADCTCRVATGSPVGRAGAALRIDGEVLVMSGSGETVPVVVLTETASPDGFSGHHDTFLVPLLQIDDCTDYTVVSTRRAGATALSEMMYGGVGTAFAAGTRLALASGGQVAVEALDVGDRLLTRDGGGQEVRWVGHSTRQAVGAMAPVTFAAGVLNNPAPLTLAGAHRIFVCQRRDRPGTGRSETLVPARDLVNGTTVRMQAGGYIDVVQIVLERHEILFAEGVAVESLPVDPRTGRILPARHHASTIDAAAVTEGGELLDRVDLLRLAAAG